MGGEKRGILAFYFKSNLLVRILLGLILGAICGVIFQNADGALGFLKLFGDLLWCRSSSARSS